MVMPRLLIAWPRCSAMPYTSSGVWVWASTRGDGWLPISAASRDTRPPSSSTLTASGSGPAEAAMSVERPVGEHRQVGPAADHDAADVMVVDDGAGVVGAGHPDHQQLRQLVAGRHAGQQRRPVAARRRTGSSGPAAPAGAGRGGRGHAWEARRTTACGGLLRRASRPAARAGQRRQCAQGAGQGHGLRH